MKTFNVLARIVAALAAAFVKRPKPKLVADPTAPAGKPKTYVVLYCGSVDDLPVLVTPDREKARSMADSIDGPDHPRVLAVSKLLGRDTTRFLCTAVVEFEGEDATLCEIRNQD